MRCSGCNDVFENENVEPACFDGDCPIWIDRLPPEALRALGLRNMLGALSDLGLSEMICKEYEVTREDVGLMMIIAQEEAELRKELNEADQAKNQR